MNKQKNKSGLVKEVLMKQITTKQNWNDLVVSASIMNSLKEIQNHLLQGEQLKNEWAVGKRMKQGFSVLFSGESGTGKTMAASLLGKSCNRQVYKVNLSKIVSKYIGETEKNLSPLFDRAENKGWILFFDEADALFGKRSEVKDAHDKYANQEVAYLLQRIEEYDGLVILASNHKSNIDPAFIRRLRMVLHFERPNVNQRHRLWKNLISKDFKLDNDVDLRSLAKNHALTGGSIVNILNTCILKSIERNNQLITKDDINSGIKIERNKKGNK